MSNEELNSVISREDDEFDKTMQDIKEQLIARIQRQEKEIERLNNIINLKQDFIKDILTILLDCNDNEIHKKIYEKGKIYDDKLKELKGDNK